MILRVPLAFLAAFTFAFGLGARAVVAADAITPYAAFVKDAQAQHGLFTIWHKDGGVYLELRADQLEHDFIQTIVPANGVGGQFVVGGNTDHLPTELLRFERAGKNVALIWPNPAFVAPHEPAAARAIERNFAKSIVGLAPIAAEDAASGTIVIDAAPFLGDQLNLKAILKANIHDRKDASPYSLDRDRTYFGSTKSFPKNVVIEAVQAWTSEDQHIADAPADPRSIQMRVVYNIADFSPSPDYMPRYADDRVGIYDDIYLSFDNDEVLTRKLRYIVRWNLAPSDPSKPLSPAKHPMIFYMSNTIPEKYRPAIRAAVLKWNDAFERIGISDALQVRDQPNDPAWDPDDIRYNVLRWVTEYEASFGADSQTLYDPRTGEEFRTGILISADVPQGAKADWTHIVDPARYGRSTDPMPSAFLDDVWSSVILHETGHNLGMQHNFIGSRAYTAAELQDKRFTSKYGIASTVMEYAPLNIWPASKGQGYYSQSVLGPYDYYAMKWAYGAIPGARTPEDEIPALSKLARAWSDPRYRYASDEDVSWNDGHAADPRVEQGILTNDPIGWCDTQTALARDLLAKLDTRFPAVGEAYEAETGAFNHVIGLYRGCAIMPARYIGGQYLSRAHRGDPGAQAPVVPVPYADQKRAFAALDRYLFADNALPLSPQLLSHLTYSEWSGYGYVGFEGYGNLPAWAYDPPARHDISARNLVAKMQGTVLNYLFAPATLARIADGASETTSGRPMRLDDLFRWMRTAVFGAGGTFLRNPSSATRRNLQVAYVDRLGAVAGLTGAAGSTGAAVPTDAAIPTDARALAREELRWLQGETASMRSGDATVRAHAAYLEARAAQALHAGHDGAGSP